MRARDAAAWPDPVAAVPLRQVPLILVDHTVDPYSVPMLTTVPTALATDCDALLVGEHQNRPDFPPGLMASLLQAAGGPTTSGRTWPRSSTWTDPAGRVGRADGGGPGDTGCAAPGPAARSAGPEAAGWGSRCGADHSAANAVTAFMAGPPRPG